MDTGHIAAVLNRLPSEARRPTRGLGCKDLAVAIVTRGRPAAREAPRFAFVV